MKNLCETCSNYLQTKMYDPNSCSNGSNYRTLAKCLYWGRSTVAHKCSMHNINKPKTNKLPSEDIDTDNFYKDGTPIDDFRDLSNPPEDGYKSGMEKAK